MGNNTLTDISFVNGMINLLIVDDNPDILGFLKELFSSLPIYKVHSAANSGDALSILRSGKRFHVCVLDLGLCDIENDEYYLLRLYAHHSSVIVLTGSNSPVKGATCIQLGARSVVEKGVNFNPHKFLELVNNYAIINIVNFRYNDSSGETLNLATRILIEKEPPSVTDWASFMRITDRQLRNLWHNGSGFSAKHILFIFTFLKQVFQYFTLLNYGAPEDKKILLSDQEIKKLRSYYIAHKDIISFILS